MGQARRSGKKVIAKLTGKVPERMVRVTQMEQRMGHGDDAHQSANTTGRGAKEGGSHMGRAEDSEEMDAGSAKKIGISVSA